MGSSQCAAVAANCMATAVARPQRGQQSGGRGGDQRAAHARPHTKAAGAVRASATAVTATRSIALATSTSLAPAFGRRNSRSTPAFEKATTAASNRSAAVPIASLTAFTIASFTAASSFNSFSAHSVSAEVAPAERKATDAIDTGCSTKPHFEDDTVCCTQMDRFSVGRGLHNVLALGQGSTQMRLLQGGTG